MDYHTWSSKSISEKKQLLKDWIQELIALNKNIASPSDQIYNKLKRRKILKINIRTVSRYMRDDYDEDEDKRKKDEKNSEHPRRY